LNEISFRSFAVLKKLSYNRDLSAKIKILQENKKLSVLNRKYLTDLTLDSFSLSTNSIFDEKIFFNSTVYRT